MHLRACYFLKIKIKSLIHENIFVLTLTHNIYFITNRKVKKELKVDDDDYEERYGEAAGEIDLEDNFRADADDDFDCGGAAEVFCVRVSLSVCLCISVCVSVCLAT